MSISNILELRIIGSERGVFSKVALEKGQALFNFERNFVNAPTRLSIQVQENIHQLSTYLEQTENHLNHSCNPPGYIDFENLTYVSFKKIAIGEEITFNYLTTEWDLINKFQCNCRSKNCYKKIEGFRFLTREKQKKLMPLLSPHLRKKFQELY